MRVGIAVRWGKGLGWVLGAGWLSACVRPEQPRVEAPKSTPEVRSEPTAASLFQIAQAASAADDPEATIQAYQLFVERHGADVEYVEQTIEAELRIGQAYTAQGARRRAEAHYHAAVSAFAASELGVGTEAAALPAEAKFLLAEYALSDMQDLRLVGAAGGLEQEVDTLLNALVAVVNAYDGVYVYKDVAWTLAAMYRRGHAFEVTAIKLRDAPVPDKLEEGSEAWLAYQSTVDAIAKRFEGKAIPLYIETVKRGAEFNITTEWVRAARERLSIHMPQAYPPQAQRREQQ